MYVCLALKTKYIMATMIAAMKIGEAQLKPLAVTRYVCGQKLRTVSDYQLRFCQYTYAQKKAHREYATAMTLSGMPKRPNENLAGGSVSGL